ncbi:endo-alpha-N-acetylgalactosaminidase family protein [Streptomyces sp. SCA3-4]|nr:endo-alpha-N-acetylgalactosaminidase family protein [Streptomyces sichuanensis]MCA6091770.1 endo-alpha-N-acetylgalactosaminidase family protein [Streptomyces sichuanensis]
MTADHPGPSRRAVVVATALAGTGLGTARAAADDHEAVLRSDALDVRVDTTFPRILTYTHRATGAVLHAQDEPVTSLLVDNTPHTPTVTTTIAADHATYTLRLAGGTRIDVEIRVDHWRTDWRVTRITDTPALRIGTLRIPALAFLSVRSTQPGAALLAARIHLDATKDGDTLVRPTATTPPDPAPTGCAYAVVSTDRLAAAIETNTVHDRPDTTTSWENGRFRRQTLTRAHHTEARLTCGEWTHRPAGAPPSATDPLPHVTVIVTGDRNGDGTVDWQDAAIAMRDIMTDPPGADEQHLRVVPHIAFNFASQATNPFLTTLDHIKRIHLATDGLRQFTLLKGYQSEGHDSAHPDYGGNYNTRAGGLDDLNTLLRRGKKWNSDFAVHVNTTESYPVAHAFSETLVDKNDRQWDWLDQSYRIDARRDLLSGDIARRFRQLREETDPALDTLYIDVFRESGWNSDALQRILHAQGWKITSEWGHGLERSSLWAHWATETDYGPDTSRGINSRLIRFIRHHQKDVFADKWPLLGTVKLGTFEGWRGKTDWTAFHRQLWTENLPAKYLQAFTLHTWHDHDITLTGPGGLTTRVTDTDGTRRITTDGRTVCTGDTYLLPWEPRRATDPTKLYHYNPHGGATTWQLPRAWAALPTVVLHRLTDQGRTDITELPVRDTRITIDAAPAQPYVLTPRHRRHRPDPHWGEGTPLHDPNFLSGTLDAWHVTGPARAERSTPGHWELVIGPGAAATVSQRTARLRPGTYAASVQVEVGTTAGERRRAALTVRTADGTTATNWTDTSTAVNHMAADSKHGTRFQRMFTWFTVPPGGGPTTLSLTAAPGTARIRFAAVRLVPGRPAPAPPGALAFEDFENVPQGWGPFVKGDAGGTTDPRTHIAQRHAPYTQRGWNGKAVDDVVDGTRSLKSRGENQGLVYRTVPHTVRFTPGRHYRVTFRYVNERADQYAWITGVDEPAPRELHRTPLPAATAPTLHSYQFTAPETGEAWVGLRKVGTNGTAEFCLDGFTVHPVGQETSTGFRPVGHRHRPVTSGTGAQRNPTSA